MNLDPNTEKHLQRLTELQALINHLGDETPEEVFLEYRGLAEPLVQEFLPVVKKLAKAGLLTLNVEEEAFAEARGYVAATYDVAQVFDNGSIWLNAGEVSMLTPKQEPKLHRWY